MREALVSDACIDIRTPAAEDVTPVEIGHVFLHLVEVHECTHVSHGLVLLHELAQAQRAGYRCAVAFVIQMEGVTEVRPNVGTQPEFGTALAEAKAAGVSVLFLLCHVGRDSLEIVEQREA